MLSILRIKKFYFMTVLFVALSCNNKPQQLSCSEVKADCLSLIKDNLPQVMELLSKQEYQDSDVKKAFKQFKFFDELEKMEHHLENNCPSTNEEYNKELQEFLAVEGLKYLLNN